MIAPPFEILDLSDAAAVAEYERGFYRAYAPGGPLTRGLWHWDDAAGRLATKVPYADQLIYVRRDAAGAIDQALAANVAMRLFQPAGFGFPAPADPTGCCDFVNFMSLSEHRLSQLFELWKATFADLRARGFTTGYGTTAPRPLPFYRRAGAEVAMTVDLGGEIRHFLRFDLTRTRW